MNDPALMDSAATGDPLAWLSGVIMAAGFVFLLTHGLIVARRLRREKYSAIERRSATNRNDADEG